jgi:hypothetical protein
MKANQVVNGGVLGVSFERVGHAPKVGNGRLEALVAFAP